MNTQKSDLEQLVSSSEDKKRNLQHSFMLDLVKLKGRKFDIQLLCVDDFKRSSLQSLCVDDFKRSSLQSLKRWMVLYTFLKVTFSSRNQYV